jgi:O-antigen/teichoic acid export membrane protein
MSDRLARLVNLSLRLTALAAKLLLMLYMARFVSPADFGEYGLVAGTAAILMTALGIRLDYVVARELVSAPALECARKMRDQLWFYGLNYGVLGIIVAIVILTRISAAANHSLAFIYVLSVLESCSAIMFTNMISRGRPITANLMLLMRSGLWVFPAVALGLGEAAFRTSNVIFVAWVCGAALSIGFAIWEWRSLPWRALRGVAVDWEWVWRSARRCTLIWVSTVGLTAGTLVDRFVVAVDLNLDLVGVLTFYASFASALYSLIESAVFYSYPRLVSLHEENNKASFDGEARRMRRTAAMLAGIIALAMAIIIPGLGMVLQRPLLVQEAPALWLLLLGTWIRINAQALYLMLFATHRDRVIWLGDLLYIVPALGGNLVLVPAFGLTGIGYSSIISSVFILVWRGWNLRPKSVQGTWTDTMAKVT